MSDKTRFIGTPMKTTLGNVLDGKLEDAFSGIDSKRLSRLQAAAPKVTGNPETVILNSVMDTEVDPVVGWVVIIQGKGKGISLPLVNGVNTIGRDPDQRVALNFGDDKITRKQHALITYEPNGHVFYLQNGMGSNLTYLETNTNVVLQPTVLRSGQCVLLGNTTLKFIALCGVDFDWHTHCA
ncbi:MAG: hypothetical protein RI964_629 [Pseudomonadota bacterium]|jgi:hypothetical protein